MHEEPPHSAPTPPRSPPSSTPSLLDWPYERASNSAETRYPPGPRNRNLLPPGIPPPKGTKASRYRAIVKAFAAIESEKLAEVPLSDGSTDALLDGANSVATSNPRGSTTGSEAGYASANAAIDCFNNPAFISRMMTLGTPGTTPVTVDIDNYPRPQRGLTRNTVLNTSAPAGGRLRHVNAPASGGALCSASSTHIKKKYYCVTRGRRTGVFDNWPYVIALTTGIDSCQVAFMSRKEALETYDTAQSMGLVQVIRNGPPDDLNFGPLEPAMQ